MRSLQREVERINDESSFTKASLREESEQSSKNFEADIKKLTEELAQSKSDYANMFETKERTEAEFKIMVGELQGRLEELEAQHQELTFQLSNAKQHEVALSASLKAAEAESMEYIQRNAVLTENIQSLELHRIETSSRIETFENNQEQMDSELSRSRQEVKCVHEQIAREQAEHANVVSELLKTKQDLADCLRRESEAKVLDVVVAKEASLASSSMSLHDLDTSRSNKITNEAQQSFLDIQVKWSAAENEASHLRIEHAKYKSAVEVSERHVSRLQQAIASAKEELALKQQKTLVLQSQITELSTSLEVAERNAKALETAHATELKQQRDKVRHLEERLTNELGYEKEQNLSISNKVNELSATLESERAKTENDTEEQFAHFRKTIHILEERIRENDSAVTEIVRLNSLLEDANENMKLVEEKAEEDSKRLSELSDICDEERRKAHCIEKENRNLRHLNTEYEKRITQIEKDHADEKTKHAHERGEMKKKMASLVSKEEGYRKTVELSKEEVSTLKSVLAKTKHKSLTLKGEIDSLSEVMRMKTDEIERRQREIKGLREDLRQSKQATRKVSLNYEDLQRTMRDKEHERFVHKSMSDEIDTLQKEKGLLKVQLEKCMVELATLKQREESTENGPSAIEESSRARTPTLSKKKNGKFKVNWESDVVNLVRKAMESKRTLYGHTIDNTFSLVQNIDREKGKF